MNQITQPTEHPDSVRVLQSDAKISETNALNDPFSTDLPTDTAEKAEDVKRKSLSLFRHFYFGSLLYALFFTFCLYRNSNGITFPFFVGGTLFFFFSCLKKSGITAKKDAPFYVISLLLLGISNFLTGSIPLILMNTAGVIILGLHFAVHSFYQDRDWTFGKHLFSVLDVSLGSLSHLNRPFTDLIWYGKTKSVSNKSKKWIEILIGLLISIPLLFVILLLLYNADIMFAEFFNSLFSGLYHIPDNLFGILFYFIFAFFAYYCIWTSLLKNKIKKEIAPQRTSEPVIAITFTSLLSFVYLIFCSFQIYYLFMGNVPAMNDTTYSAYAREGFFQLLFVCLINLILVLVCLGRFRENKTLKILLTIITVCTYIMIASSAMRMLLYIAFYQLTFLRLLVLWALLIIAVLITGVLITIYKPSFSLFRFGAVSVTVLYLIFSFSHPDYWIASYNLQSHTYTIHSQGREEVINTDPSGIDFSYLSFLSTDAAPAILSGTSSFISPEYMKSLRNTFIDNIGMASMSNYSKMNIRTFNLSRFIAENYRMSYPEDISKHRQYLWIN